MKNISTKRLNLRKLKTFIKENGYILTHAYAESLNIEEVLNSESTCAFSNKDTVMVVLVENFDAGMGIYTCVIMDK